MSDAATTLSGPDLAAGVPVSNLPDGAMLLGHAHGQTVLLARRGNELFAIGALCTHYGGPLGDGLLVDDTIRCPWHHACFSLRTGEALRKRLAVATVYRDIESLGAELAFEKAIAAKPA